MLVCMISVSALLSTPANAGKIIDWQLENSFRLFKKPSDTQLHHDVFKQLTAAESKSPILAAERRLELLSGGRGWADAVFNHTCYDQDNDRYSACPDYVLPKSHRIIAYLRDKESFWDIFTPEDKNAECTWKVVDRKGKTVSEATASCAERVKLDIPYPDGGRVGVSKSDGERIKPLAVKIRDVLIVGLGDSFAAGEGNPDHPVTFDNTRAFNYGYVDIAATGKRETLNGYPAREGAWKKINTPAFKKERARWWDRECHRSLYSHQLRAALQLAVEDPKRAITFISFSCSGAEITQGLLLSKPVRECTPGENFLVKPQLSALSEELCESVVKNAPMPAAVINRIPELRNLSEDEMRISRCLTPDHKPALKRSVDLVFLSVGGNDVGFVSLVSDTMLSDGSIYRRLGNHLGSVYGVDEARKRLELVKSRYDGLRFALETMLSVRSGSRSNSHVIVTGYPNMGYGTDGVSACSGAKGMDVFPPFQLNAEKVASAENFSQELNKQLADIAGRNWTYVDGYRDDFRTHGLCATNGNGIADTLTLPRFLNGAWKPYKPSQYAPYTPRQRWYRTPNDAFLTSNMHASAIANFGANCSRIYTVPMRKLARRYWTPFQVFLSSTYGGAFHPTAEGQAAMADRLAASARDILDGRSSGSGRRR